jgi:hypothetical protein
MACGETAIRFTNISHVPFMVLILGKPEVHYILLFAGCWLVVSMHPEGLAADPGGRGV